MSSYNSTILHHASRIKKYIDSKRFLSKKIEWYSNGTRGHLHGTTRCIKVHKSNLPSVKQSLTLEKALEKKICDSCYQRAFDTLFNNNTSDVISLIQIGDSLARFTSQEDLKDQRIDKIYDVVQSTRQHKRNLERLRDAVVESNFSKYYDKLQGDIKLILDRYIKALEEKKSDLLSDITLKMLMPETSYGVDEVNFSQEFYRLATGEDRYQARSVASLYTNWVANFSKLDKAQRKETTLQDSRNIRLTGINQLVGLNFKNDHLKGSTILQSIEEDWRSELDSCLEDLINSWEERATKFFSLTTTKIIGIYLPSFRNDTYLNLLIDVFKVTPINKETQIVILKAPEIVATYLLKVTELSNRSVDRSKPVAVVDADENLDELSLLTATSLWTPEESSVYQNFANAIKASATL